MATHSFQLTRRWHAAAPARQPGAPREHLVTGAVRSYTSPLLHSIRVLSGRAWITCESDRLDHTLEAGDVFVPTTPGRTVLQAMTPCTIEVDQG